MLLDGKSVMNKSDTQNISKMGKSLMFSTINKNVEMSR